jgi:tetratricopeptide (TPR) repeat protein
MEGSLTALKLGAPYEAEQILSSLLREVGVNQGASARVSLLLSRALLDQSKADRAVPLLDQILLGGTLSREEIAEAARMRAAAEYLLNREDGERYVQAATRALATAREANDSHLTARALFEYARSGVELGSEDRVRFALQELLTMLQHPHGEEDPVVLHALAFCHFFFFDLKSAGACLERAIQVLREASDSFTLNHVYNGYAMCKHYSCQFAEAEGAYRAALDLAKKLGDLSRASIIASNLSSLYCTKGEYLVSIDLAKYSIEAASRGPNQPHVLSCYTNLAEAYALSGDVPSALQCIQAAMQQPMNNQPWRARVGYKADVANLWLLIGNDCAAIETIGEMEVIANGRERAVPDVGEVERLRVFRVGHTQDAALALEMSKRAKKRFEDRHMMFYLDALSAQAWAERRVYGRLTWETKAALRVFEKPELVGKTTALTTQGFLA